MGVTARPIIQPISERFRTRRISVAGFDGDDVVFGYDDRRRRAKTVLRGAEAGDGRLVS
jgi:hypothetical protein